MAYNTGKSQMYPSATNEPPTHSNDFQRGPPPPSYEECLKMPTVVVPHHQHHNYNTTTYQQLSQAPPSYQMPQYAVNYSMSESGTSYGYVNPYQTHMHQQQIYYNTSASVASPEAINNVSENVLLFAKGAQIRNKATGAISIPPPPPGCAPTPAQLKAMSGQPVIVKQQKTSFF